VLRHMRHQELWRAVGTHYGPTRIYGPTGHAIGGTAQQALRELLPQLPLPGLSTISDDYGPAAICQSMDLAAAAGARATRMSLLRAGDAAGAWRTRTGATPCDGTDDYVTAGAGRRVSPGARDSECSASQLDAACVAPVLVRQLHRRPIVDSFESRGLRRRRRGPYSGRSKTIPHPAQLLLLRLPRVSYCALQCSPGGAGSLLAVDQNESCSPRRAPSGPHLIRWHTGPGPPPARLRGRVC